MTQPVISFTAKGEYYEWDHGLKQWKHTVGKLIVLVDPKDPDFPKAEAKKAGVPNAE